MANLLEKKERQNNIYIYIPTKAKQYLNGIAFNKLNG